MDVPPELTERHHDLTFCMDIMFLNGMPMLTGIDRSIRVRVLIALDNRSESEIFRGMKSVLRVYDDAGFRIKRIICDQEFRHMMERVSEEFNVEMNYATAGEHVPEAERNNRTIQERIRATYHNLPYAMIPKTMLKYLAMISTAQLNYFPAKGGISPYFSPHTIMTKIRLITLSTARSLSGPMFRQTMNLILPTPVPRVPLTAFTCVLFQTFREDTN
jgi:hypothetical protein